MVTLKKIQGEPNPFTFSNNGDLTTDLCFESLGDPILTTELRFQLGSPGNYGDFENSKSDDSEAYIFIVKSFHDYNGK